MKEIALPQEDAARKKKARSLRALRKFTGGAMFALAILAIACLIGVLVVVILTQTGERDPARDTLLYILTGAFAGGAVVLALAAFGTGVVDSFFWFNVYRIVGGFGIGIASNVSPVYIAEVSPAAVRGKFVSINQLTIVLGILLAQIVNWRIGDFFTAGSEVLSDRSVEWAWRWMFWAELAPACLFFFLSFLIPESPRWLAAMGRDAEAATILTRIAGRDYAARTLEELGRVAPAGEERIRWRSLVSPGTRGVLVIGVVLAVFQQWCGINVIFNYAHEIFSAAGYAVSEVLMNIVVTGVTNVVFTFVAIYTVDRWGRRTLMFVGAAGLATIYALLGAGYFVGASGWPMLLLVVLAIACYAMSLAPVVWVVLSEIFPTRVRGMAMAVSTFFLWVAAIFLIIANASAYLHSQTHLSKTILLEIAGISFAICVFNFWVGQFLGGKKFRREASQVLGQKNTTLTIYLAMTYANPLVALGPTFYVLWHNGWNTFQLHMYDRRHHLRELKRKKNNP